MTEIMEWIDWLLTYTYAIGSTILLLVLAFEGRGK